MIAALALVLAGLLQAASLAWPMELGLAGWLEQGQPSGLLQLLALLTLAWVLHNKPSVKQVFFLTWLFVTTWLCTTFGWLYISMHVYGGLAAWMAALAVFALAGALALYYAAAMATLAYYRLSGVPWALVFGCAWTLAELMRGQWLTGFPWGAVGYAHVDSALRVWAPWLGVYGVGWIAACLSAALVVVGKTVLGQTQGRASALQGVLLVSAIGVSSAALALLADTHMGRWGHSSGEIAVTLVQGNIAQNEKFDQEAGVPEALDWYARAIAQAKGQLIVAPETAIALLPQQLPPEYLPSVMRSLEPKGMPAKTLLIGMPWGEPQSGYTNTVVALNGQSGAPGGGGVLYRYDKHHLVPFGEFIPPFFRWFTRMMNIPLGDFKRGGLDQAPFEKWGQKIAPNICYEDLFGEELSVRYVTKDQAPTVMVNLSNIGWFGDSLAIDQHLQISRMRTLEMQRPMIRATNTGASAVIDHKGEVVWSLPRLQKAQATGVVEGRTGTITPYALWAGNWGLLPLWGVCLALSMWLCQPLRRPTKSQAGSCEAAG
jgi:apolipoprotein N-acyltransferase